MGRKRKPITPEMIMDTLDIGVQDVENPCARYKMDVTKCFDMYNNDITKCWRDVLALERCQANEKVVQHQQKTQGLQYRNFVSMARKILNRRQLPK